MNNLNKKKEEKIMNEEEEPVPEEYKEDKFKIKNNTNKNILPQNINEFSRPNIVISSNPKINSISSINNKKNINTENNKIMNNNNNNNSITLSRVSKAKTTLSNFDNSKFENYNIEKIRYNIMKDYSHIHLDKDLNFIDRMRYDICKRQSKESKINEILEKNKVKMNEDDRIKVFNNLIEDANRRFEAQENMEKMKYKLSEDFISKEKKKYNDEEWKEIYKKRFKSYEENINKKKEEMVKNEEIKKLKKENDDINLFKSKKKPKKLIEEAAQRMYDEAKRRKIKMNEKINRINQYNNEIEDATKYTKKIKSESYSFLDDEDDNNENNNNNNIKNLKNGLSYNDFYVDKKNNKIRKKKGMSVSEFNNKRFDKRPQTGKSYNNKSNSVNNNSNNNKMNQIYFNEYMKKNEIYYNLEEERDKLLKMSNNIKRYNINNKKEIEINEGKHSTGASNIVEQFFLRQINDNNI